MHGLNLFNGNPIWRVSLGGDILSSAAVAGEELYVGSSDGNVYAFEREIGEILWTVPADDLVWTSPAVVDGKLYFGSHDGLVYAYGA